MSLSSTTSLISTNSAALRERNEDVEEEDADSATLSTSLLSMLVAALVLIPATTVFLFFAWRKGCRRAAEREGAQHDKKPRVPSSGSAATEVVTTPGLVSGGTLHDELSVSSHEDSVADVENKVDFV